MRKDTLCFIPARSGSKGVKNKNIRILKNKPLFIHSLNFAKKLNFVKRIIFSTDSKKYLSIAKKYNFKFDSLRPKVLSNDDVKTIDVIKYEIKQLSKENLRGIKYILLLQPTCPFRKISDFKKAYKSLKKGFDSVITIRKVKDYPQQMLKKNYNGTFSHVISNNNFLPRQKHNQLYIRAGSMYFFKIEILKSKKFNLGKKIFGIEVHGKYQINIDSSEDLDKASNY